MGAVTHFSFAVVAGLFKEQWNGLWSMQSPGTACRRAHFMLRDLARGKPPSEQPSTKGLQDLSHPDAPQQGPDCLGWVTSRAVTNGKTRRRSEFGKYLAIIHLCSYRQLNCFLSATLLNGKRLLSIILGCVTSARRTRRSASWGFYSPIRRRREWADPMAMEK